MNTIKPLLISTLATLILLAGCKDPDSIEDNTPEDQLVKVTINGEVNPDQLTLDVGDTLFYTVGITSPDGIKEYAASYLKDGVVTIFDQLEPDTAVYILNQTERQLVIDYTFSGNEYTFFFAVTHTTDSVSSHSFVLNVNESPFESRTGIVVSPYNQFLNGNLYNVVEDTLYFPINVKTDLDNQRGVDLIFGFDSQAGYMVSSPSDAYADTLWNHYVSFYWPFLEINATQLLEVDGSSVNFNQIVTAQQIVDLLNGATVTSLNQLHVDQLIAFRLDNSKSGKAGLMRITNISGSVKNDDQQITFDLKFQL